MSIKEKLDTLKGVETVWGKIISEKESFTYAERQIAAYSANIFQVMRILEPDFNKRTAAICSTAYAVSMMAENNREEYIKNFRDENNIPEFCEQSSWLGGLAGDSGDEMQMMAGRVIQFTPDRVEKELDTCPWDIVGAEMCNMTTATFMANFDLIRSEGAEMNEMTLDMCEARGCGDMHCRVVAERRDVFNRKAQGPLDHFGQPAGPVTVTPREKMFKESTVTRNGKYINPFGVEKTLEESYHWSMWAGFSWSIAFPLMAIKKMAPTEEEFNRILKIVFSAAGKAAFIEPFAVKGMRDWLGVPNGIDANDGRLLGGYIKAHLDTHLLPNELVQFDEEETRIEVKVADFQGRLEYMPIPELITGYEALWHNMAKTMVSAEWSCWFEGKDKEIMTIVVARKIDKKMI